MLGLLYYPLLAGGIYFLYHLFRYINNILTARKIGFPTVHFPLFPQNHVVWVIMGPLGRLSYKRYLPTWLYNRVALLIYGLEFFQKDQPFTEYVIPQVKANPKLLGKGKTYFLVTGGRLELWTWDAEIAREVTSRPGEFVQFDMASVVMNVFGDNVLTSDGANWARHRRIVAGAVTERVSPLVWNESVRQTRALLASLENKLEQGATNEMFDMVKRVTIHVLYAAGMGNRQDFDGGKDLVDGDKVKTGMSMSYIDAVKIVNENAAGFTVLPTRFLRNYPSFLPGSKWLNDLGQAKVEFPIHTRAALAKEKQHTAETGQARNNVMSALIAASELNEGDVEKGRKGPALSDGELMGNLYIFTAAGFDTTANTIAYSLLFLARHPRWQDWLFEELDALLPSDPAADFDYTSIFPKAHRTLAIMLETLRLFPAVIHIAKMTRKPVTVTTASCGMFTVPANTTVYVNNVMLHRDPAVWRHLNMTPLERKAAAEDEDGIQADEQKYRPSRWINSSGSATPVFQPPKGTYLPWSAGPRVCPGQKMAQVEFVAILATLFSRHRMEIVRKMIPVVGAPPDVQIPEGNDALNRRLDALMEDSTPKLTLEMDVYNILAGEKRGLGMRWLPRR